MTRHREVERKFDADPGAPLPDLSGAAAAVSEAVGSQLDATYFDTADTRLARHGITLRRRTGGDDAGWHLKLPAGQDERTEIRLPLGRATRTVPRSLALEVRAIVRDRPLVPVAVLHTTRIERRLLDGDGNTLATIADDTVHGQRLADGAVQESTWREVEVELLDGDRSFLDTVSSRLRAAGLTPSESSSKLARVLGDIADPTLAAAPEGMINAGRATAGAVVLAHLRGQVDQLVTRDRGARADEPDAVHQMWVATCRLRSALATYRPLLDRERTDPVRQELNWFGQVLGRPRVTEALHWRLGDLVAAQPDELVLGPVGHRVDLKLGDRHRAALADLVAALDGDRYFRLLDALDSLLADPPFTARAGKPARTQLPALVGRTAGRVDRAAQAVADDRTPQARDQGLCEVRKYAKRARYAAESAVPVSGRPARRLADRMEALQDVLGEHQDSVVARALLFELAVAAHESGENGFTFGLLYAQERARASDARRAYGPALRKASTTRARRWTR
ncbi:MAG: CYTH and CHAD domain-containing protein [Dermatophilaceae bacterium]